jgi:hypothetical protein
LLLMSQTMAMNQTNLITYVVLLPCNENCISI